MRHNNIFTMSLSKHWKESDDGPTPLSRKQWHASRFGPAKTGDGTMDAVSETNLLESMTSEELANAIAPTRAHTQNVTRSEDFLDLSTAQLVKEWKTNPQNFHVLMFLRAPLGTTSQAEMYSRATAAFSYFGKHRLATDYTRHTGVRATIHGWVRVLDYTGQAVLIYLHSRYGERKELHYKTNPSNCVSVEYNPNDLKAHDPVACPFRMDGTVPAGIIGHLTHMRRAIPFADRKLYAYAIMGKLMTASGSEQSFIGGHLAKRHLAIQLLRRMRDTGDEDFSDHRLDREAIPICNCRFCACDCVVEPPCEGAGVVVEPSAGTKRAREEADEDLTDDEGEEPEVEGLNDFQKQQLENLISIMSPKYERVFARMMPFSYVDLKEVERSGSEVYRSDPYGGSPLGFLSMAPRAGKTRVFLFFAERWLNENPTGFCVVGAVQAGSRDLWIKEAHKIGMAHRVIAVGPKQECPQEPGKIYVMLHRKLGDCVTVADTPVLMGIDESHCMSVDLCAKVHRLMSIFKTIHLVCISATPLGKTGAGSVTDSFKLYGRMVKLLGMKANVTARVDQKIAIQWWNSLIQSHATTLPTDMDGSCWLPPQYEGLDVNKLMVEFMLDLPKMVIDLTGLRAKAGESEQKIQTRNNIVRSLELAAERGELTEPVPAPVNVSDIVRHMQVHKYKLHESDIEIIEKIEQKIQELRDLTGHLRRFGLNKLRTVERLIERLSDKLFQASNSEQLRKILQHAETKVQWYSNMHLTTHEMSDMRTTHELKYTEGDMPKESFERIRQKSQNYTEADWQCPICQDECSDAITQCGHAHCLSCLQQWVDATHKASCPTCRTTIRQVFKVTIGTEHEGRNVTVHCANHEKLANRQLVQTPNTGPNAQLQASDQCGSRLTDCVVEQLQALAPWESVTRQRVVVFVNSSMVYPLRKELSERLDRRARPCASLNLFNAHPDKYQILICSYFLATAVTIDAKIILMASPPPDASAFRQAVCRTYMVQEDEVPTQLMLCAVDHDRWWATFKSRMSVQENIDAESGETKYSLTTEVARKRTDRNIRRRPRRQHPWEYAGY